MTNKNGSLQCKLVIFSLCKKQIKSLPDSYGQNDVHLTIKIVEHDKSFELLATTRFYADFIKTSSTDPCW